MITFWYYFNGFVATIAFSVWIVGVIAFFEWMGKCPYKHIEPLDKIKNK